MNRSLNEWMRAATGGASLREIAKRSGIKQATLARQVSEHRVSAESVAAIAHAYGANVLEGLLAHGLLVADDIADVRQLVGLREASDAEIADEILRRLNERGTDNLDEEPPARSSDRPIRLLSDDFDPSELEGLPYAADAERAGDDPGEDDD